MALSLIAYPKIIYIQSAEPTNKTTGLLWHDTDNGKLYSADGSNYNEIGEEYNPNKLKGIVPTVTGWGTNPTDLTNLTDENLATNCSWSYPINLGTGVTAYINFDIGKLQLIRQIGINVNAVNNSLGSFVKIEISPDNSNWAELTDLMMNAGTVKAEFDEAPITSLQTRYIRIKVYMINNGGGTQSCSFGQIFAK